MPNRSTKEEGQARDASERALLVQRGQEVSTDVQEALNTGELGMIPLDLAEKLLVQGDLSELAPKERLLYYQSLCRSLGLNPISRPFEYLLFKGKLSLYATKECAAQLRTQRGVSFEGLQTSLEAGLLIVRVKASLPDGRTDIDEGVVAIDGLRGDDLANARLKAITKAKRRVTLSICGLGMLDETELDSMRGVVRITSAEAHTLDKLAIEGMVANPAADPELIRMGTGGSERAPEPRGSAKGHTGAAPGQPVTEVQPQSVAANLSSELERGNLVSEVQSLWAKLERAGWLTKDIWMEYVALIGSRAKVDTLTTDQLKLVVAKFKALIKAQQPQASEPEASTANH